MFFCGPSSFWYDHCNLFCGIFFLDIIAWTLTNVVYDLKSTIREIEKVAILPCPVTTTSTKFSSFNFWTQADVCSCHISPTCFETLLLIHFNFLRVQSGTAAQILNFFLMEREVIQEPLMSAVSVFLYWWNIWQKKRIYFRDLIRCAARLFLL